MPDKRKTLDISTLNTSKKGEDNDYRHRENVFYKNLHVRQSRSIINQMIKPRGISIRTHGYDVNERMQSEGTLITVYCTNRRPNILSCRQQEELDAFINSKLDVITENPNEIRDYKPKIKIETKIYDEKRASKAYNIREEYGDTIGEV